jgi:FAD/FMN-containing dehydrogenase
VPLAVARPLDADDVSAAVRWAVANEAALRVKSGGHSYAEYSTVAGGIVLDLRNIKQLRIESDGATATVVAGAPLIDV